jgi:GTP-binding protein
VEGISVLLARRAIATADIVVLLIDATQGAADQDGAIAGEAERAGRSIILAVNKWDLVKAEGEDFAEKFDDKLRFQLKFLEFAPIIHISALTGERTPKLLDMIDKVLQERTYRVPTPELNRFIKEITESHPPPSPGRGAVRIMYAAQVGVSPPTFALFTNIATEFHFSYERFLVNQIRKEFGFSGTPIRLQVRRRERKSGTKSSEQGRPQKPQKHTQKFVPKGPQKQAQKYGRPGGKGAPHRGPKGSAPGGGKSGRRRRKAAGVRRP